MTPEVLKTTRLLRRNSDYIDKNYHPFDRLTLTLSKQGWTASVQWEGLIGARGRAQTIEDAIDASIVFAEKEWNARVILP